MIYTQRIFWPSYNSETKLAHLLEFLDRNRAICDEISFFTEGDGMDWRYLPRDEVDTRATFLKHAVHTAHAAGFDTAINILNTMGHSDEGGEAAPTLPWQPIVGHDDTVSRQCSCPFDNDFLEYLVVKYEAFSHSGAGKYWIDDDVRFSNHHPVNWGCFCERCLADFSARTGRIFSRAQLVEALRCETEVREQWIARNNGVIKGVLAACADGVQRAARTSEIGFMMCGVTDLHDCGVDLTQWFGELTTRVSGQAWLRPGGGFWSDAHPRSVLHKIQAVGFSIDASPPGVKSTYEVENYPFIQGAKSAAQTGLECLLVSLATKIDGVMFDVLDPVGNGLEPFEQWAQDLGEWRPLWERASDLVQNTIPCGWKPAFSLRHFEQHRSHDLNAMRHIAYQDSLALQPAGLPMTGFDAGARGHILCGATALGMRDAELHDLLQKPLLMDAPAARIMIDAGLGGAIGIEEVTEYTEGVYEEFTDHPLNGAAKTYKRSATLCYFAERSYALATLPGTQILSNLRETGGRSLGAALSCFTSPTGTPVAVVGHLPWQFVVSPQRMQQLQNLSHHMIGLKPVTSTRPVAAWWRVGAGKTLAILFNAGFDDATHLYVPAGGALALSTPGISFDATQSSVTLPGWSVAVIQWNGDVPTV